MMISNKTEISPNIVGADLIQYNRSDNGYIKLSFCTNNFHVHTLEETREPSVFLGYWDSEIGFYDDQTFAAMYSDRLSDLNGKVIRLTSWSYPPMSVAEPVIDGIEGRFITLYCFMHNCSIKRITDDFMWGSVFVNMTGNGVIGQVFTELADMGACGVYMWPRELWFVDWSYMYSTSVITCLVAKPSLLPAWMVPFLPFDLRLWLTLLASWIIAAASLRIITAIAYKYTKFGPELKQKNQFFDMKDSLIRALGLILLQAPSSRMIGSSPNRHLFTSFEILFLFVTACYGAGLASYLTVPVYYPAIDSLHDLLESGMNWLVEHEAFLYSFKDVADADIIKLSQRAMVKPPEELIKLGMSGKYGVGLEVLASGYAPEQPYITEELVSQSHVMKEALYGSPLGVVIQKGSPYAEGLNMLIHRIHDAGIMAYWEDEIARDFLTPGIQSGLRRKKEHNTDVPTELRLKHIEGCIFMLLIGYILSIIVFFSELAKRKGKKKMRNL